MTLEEESRLSFYRELTVLDEKKEYSSGAGYKEQ